MKTIGILGGMSWESTLLYYQLINTAIKRELGGHHSAEILLYSFDFDTVKQLQFEGKWSEAGALLGNWARKLQETGAESIIIATNTMHRVYEQVEKYIHVPLIHIADGTGEEIRKKGYKKVGLLGTKFTMEEDFYKNRLIKKYGLEPVIPDAPQRQEVHDIIYNELCLGNIKDSSRKRYIETINSLKSNGAECVILGCTEIAMLIDERSSPLPIFDTTRIHAEYAVRYSLLQS